MNIAQILNNRVHWIFVSEEMPEFPPDSQGKPIILIDITDNPEIQEGWDYNSETGEFTEPTSREIPVPKPESTIDDRVAQLEQLVADLASLQLGV